MLAIAPSCGNEMQSQVRKRDLAWPLLGAEEGQPIWFRHLWKLLETLRRVS